MVARESPLARHPDDEAATRDNRSLLVHYPTVDSPLYSYPERHLPGSSGRQRGQGGIGSLAACGLNRQVVAAIRVEPLEADVALRSKTSLSHDHTRAILVGPQVHGPALNGFFVRPDDPNQESAPGA